MITGQIKTVKDWRRQVTCSGTALGGKLSKQANKNLEWAELKAQVI